MKESIRLKLESVRDRFEEIAGLLADPDIIGDQNQFRDLSREYAQLEPVVNCYQDYTCARDNLESAEEMLADKDPEMREMAVEEKATASKQVNSLETELQKLLLPKDPEDEKSAIVEIRAGTGGDEASIFAGDLYRMYIKFFESKRWKASTTSFTEGTVGGYKEIIMNVSGEGVYGIMKYESGVHRVQRVPVTEAEQIVAALPRVDTVSVILTAHGPAAKAPEPPSLKVGRHPTPQAGPARRSRGCRRPRRARRTG